jgi:ABC-type Zn uptake system ZnuABC Zn-binding protein ZnuA
MRLLSQAQVLFFNGAGLEEWWGKTLRSVKRADVPVVELSQRLATLRLPGEEQAGAPDPHAWLDPILVRTYVDRIRDALSRQDPTGAGGYAERAKAYQAKLTDLDAWIQSEVERIPPARRKMITFHDAFQYFAKRYGLAVGFLVASPGREPSARTLAELTRRIRQEGVPAVFAEADFSPKLLQVLARDAGVKVVTNLYDGSLSNGPPADSYLALMRHDVTMIAGALK